MPMITLRFATSRTDSNLKRVLAKSVTRLAAQVLHKDEMVASILVEEAQADDWFCAGRSLTEAGLASFWLDIRITDGTNTKDEKAAFIRAAFQTMGELLGPLHEESYVHVHDVRADGYGYGGVTQEGRYIAGKLKSAA